MNRFIALGITVLVIVAAWMGAWFYGAAQIRQTLENVSADAQRQGVDIECEQLDITGLPFRFDVFCNDLYVEANDISVTLPRLTATARIYAPTHLLLFAQGPLSIDDAFTGSRRQLTWQNMVASARTNGFALNRISLEAENIELTDTLFNAQVLGRASAFELHVLDAPETYNDAAKTSTWSIFSLASETDWPELDILQAQFRFEAELPSMPDDLRNLSLPLLANQWREPNPKIKLHIFEGRDENDEFSLTGELGLDDNAAWQGDFDLTTLGLDTRLADWTSPQMLQVFLGDKTADGKLYRAYSLQHGVLFAGNIPITALPPLL